MKQLRKVQGQKGFTLVEIAIVLVIVGLVIFGVLKGAEMVKGAKAKKTIRQVEQLRTAIITYSDKYNGKLPGYNGGAQAVTTGVFEDMTVAGLIAYDGVSMQNGFSGAVTAAAAAVAPLLITITTADIPQYVAKQLDNGLDDGAAATGDVQYTPIDATDLEELVTVTIKQN